MTVLIHFGRRVPRRWYERTFVKVKGLLTFQENIWVIITAALRKAKKKATEDGRLKFVITKKLEKEDLNYYIEWFIVTIQGTPEMEEEEYNEAMKIYDKFDKIFKKDHSKDENLAKVFQTKMLPKEKIDAAYREGYGAVSNKNIANKLLEMGILTHIEWQKDFDSRPDKGLGFVKS